MLDLRKMVLSLRPEEMRWARFALDVFFGALIGATLAGLEPLNRLSQLVLIAAVALAYLSVSVARLAKPGYSAGRTVSLLALAGFTIAVTFLASDLAIAVTTTMLAMGCWGIGAAGLDFLFHPALKSSDGDESGVVATTVEPGCHQPWLTYGLVPFALVPSLVASYLRWASINSQYSAYVLHGSGIFEIMLVFAQLTLLVTGIRLAEDGARELDKPVSLLDRDDQAIKRHGGRLLVIGAIAIGLTLLQKAQTLHSLAGSGDVSAGTEATKSISFFDLMTWLGTFGTLAIVICGALVAIYAKRREDEARRLDSVRTMRQEWINKVRDLVASLTETARLLHVDGMDSTANPKLAQEAVASLRRLELHLNPTEAHHSVLMWGLKALMKHSLLYEHLRGGVGKPVGPVEWDLLHDWIVALAQLVLKIEWLVTSDGREAIAAKASTLWDDLRLYETKHWGHLMQMAPQACVRRNKYGSSLVGNSAMGLDAIAKADAPNGSSEEQEVIA